MFLQETFVVEDCIRYDKCDTNKVSSYTFNRIAYSGEGQGSSTQVLSFDTDSYKITKTYDSTTGSYYYLPLATHLNSQVELSFKSYSTYSTSNSYYYEDIGLGLVDYTNKKANTLYMRVNNGTKRFTKITNETTMSHTYNQSLNHDYSGVWLKHKLVVNGSSFTYTISDSSDNTLWEYSNSFDSNLSGKELAIISGWNNAVHKIKEIKVKAL